ncbi:MAG: DNA polymerase IV [Phycisphaerae bacterium]|nr:DNA polymerase IV [Phycisphaerae bacterium]
MDAFYASVEQRDNPALKGKPVLVGGTPEQRGVVAAASYEARPFGIHSAMPMAQALRLCPAATVLPVRMAKYVEVSRQIRQILLTCTSQIEPISIDEAFLDVTGSVSLLGSAETIAARIKTQIREQTELTASVGVAPNKFLAKLGSDLEKPDGLVVITEGNKQQILDPLPVSRIWGIGKVTAAALHRMGILTIEQLRTASVSTVRMVLKNQTDAILRLAQGIDDRTVEPEHTSKSISSEETFATDIQNKDVLLQVLWNQVEEVAQRLRAENLQARTITLKIRHRDFQTLTRSSTMEQPTNTTKRLWEEARLVFLRWHKSSGAALRLLGFGASGLSPEGSGQLLLFADPQEKKDREVDRVFDQIRDKYGDDAMKRG